MFIAALSVFSSPSPLIQRDSEKDNAGIIRIKKIIFFIFYPFSSSLQPQVLVKMELWVLLFWMRHKAC